MIKLSVSAKIAIGYLFFLIVLVLCIKLVYDNARAFLRLDQTEERISHRRDVTDSLVYTLLEANNYERAVCLGEVDDWTSYDRSVKRTQSLATNLKTFINDSVTHHKIDSLNLFLDRKRKNTWNVMVMLSQNHDDKYLQQKVENLRQGKDSIVLRPKTVEKKQDKEVVYEVVKTRKGFFGRLADAFRKQRNDTVNVRYQQHAQVEDSVEHSIDVADSVAVVLSEIHEKEQQARALQARRIRSREGKQQKVGVELTRRVAQLLNEIRVNEYRELQQAIDDDANARYNMIHRIVFLGIIAVLSALVLLFFIMRDIRRRQQYSEHLEEAKAETERIMAQRERLLLTITHDIKAPAASISGFIELLHECVHDERGGSYLRNIKSSAHHLLNLVGALLDYHRLESGNVEVQESTFDPARLVKGCVEEMLPQAREKGLSLCCDTQACRAKLCVGDAFRIKQIINNLLNNALKYTAEGEVNVTASLTDNLLRINVADTGCGMTPEESQRVFHAFTRLPNAQGIEGVGLGLSITKELLNLLRGNITIRSRKGKGSTFYVTLPVSEASHGADAAMEEKLSTPSAKAQQNTISTKVNGNNGDLKVMILDDDALQLRLTCELLRRISDSKWQVAAFQQVTEAVEWAMKEQPTLVFIDIEMPEMNGMEVLHRYPRLKEATCIAMTAHDESIAPSLRLAGFDTCIFKPIDAGQLSKALTPYVGTLSANVQEETKSHHLDALTAFACGDQEAEQEILESFGKELAAHLALLRNALEGLRKEDIAKVAHKALPTLHLIQSAEEEHLKALSPERINTLDDTLVKEYTLRVIAEMESLLKEVAKRQQG